MFPPPLPLSNSYVWKRKSKSCHHETFLFRAKGDRWRSPRKFAELSCEWEQWLQFLTQKAGNVLADKVCKEANGSWKYWSRNYVTTWSLLCDGGSEGGRWHHRWIQGAKESQHPILVWSRSSLEKTQLKFLPASLPSLDTENCPPSPHCSRTNPWGDRPKLQTQEQEPCPWRYNPSVLCLSPK